MRLRRRQIKHVPGECDYGFHKTRCESCGECQCYCGCALGKRTFVQKDYVRLTKERNDLRDALQMMWSGYLLPITDKQAETVRRLLEKHG